MIQEPSATAYRWSLLAVIALSLLVRGAVIARGVGFLDDPDNYLPLARSLAEGRGFSFQKKPTAYRPPLYPLVLAPLVATLGDRLVWGVAALHLACGVGTVGLTASTARRWGLSRGRALLAAAIVALDPVLAAQSRSVMTETLAALLVAATLRAVTVEGRRGAALGGLGFGLCALCRPSLLPAAGLSAIAILGTGTGKTADRVRSAAVLLLVTAATLGPWAVRNARVFGEPVWTTTHGGYTLALANNPIYYDDVLNSATSTVWSGPNQERWWDEVSRQTLGLSEPEADRRLRSLGLRMLSERPRDFARAALARLGRFWGLAPSGAVYPVWLRLATAAWTLPLWIALALGLGRRFPWRWPRAPAPLFIIALTAVHLFFWTDLRMRSPIVPALALVAAAGTIRTALATGPGSAPRAPQKNKKFPDFYCSKFGESLG